MLAKQTKAVEANGITSTLIKVLGRIFAETVCIFEVNKVGKVESDANVNSDPVQKLFP